MNNIKSRNGNATADVGLILFLFAIFAAWLTHIIHCLITAKYLLLIAGAFIAPVGVIHGIGLWFGVNW